LLQTALPQAPSQPAPSGRGSTFNIGSFNVLGNSHTRPGGEKPSMDAGPTRMHRAVQLIQQKQLDVVGFQEFQAPQAKEFQKLAGQQYGLFHAKGDTVNSIAWRKDKFQLVSAETFKVPYFNGHMVEMPIVRLRDKQTGQEAYFMNTHNPADTYRFHHQQAYRERDTQIEAATIARLKQSGLPVFFTGDMNEHEPFFDRLTHSTPMVTANDAKTRAHGIDWITATPGVRFDHFRRDRSKLVQATTDHPIVTARARIDG
jgi:endonuclease/exonuclease/phosphatase family metal-dependent hydrolase